MLGNASTTSVQRGISMASTKCWTRFCSSKNGQLNFRRSRKRRVGCNRSQWRYYKVRNSRLTQNQLHENINRRGPRMLEKSTEAKIQSHIKEFMRIQKGDLKMKHRKRDNASGISSHRSNIARAMRVRMPRVPADLALPETNTEKVTNLAPQITSFNIDKSCAAKHRDPATN